MKLILVPVAGKPECKSALQQAFGLADDLSANVIACHLQAGEAGASNRKAQLRIMAGKSHADRPDKRTTQAVGKAAHDLIVAEAGRHGFDMRKRANVGMVRSCMWFEITGDLDKLFPIVGPVADMSVVSRPKSGARGRASEFMLTALMYSGKPVLIMPQRPMSVVGQRILIAWDQSVDAARAVSAALPLLQRADSVVICSCGPENLPGPKSASLAQYLACWGIKTSKAGARGRDIPEELEAACKETNSDLIVMGAYTRSRMSELIFGGVTEHMLFRTSMPIFALHS